MPCTVKLREGSLTALVYTEGVHGCAGCQGCAPAGVSHHRGARGAQEGADGRLGGRGQGRCYSVLRSTVTTK